MKTAKAENLKKSQKYFPARFARLLFCFEMDSDISMLMFDDKNNVNTTHSSTSSEGGNDRYDKLLQQNAKLTEEMKRMWTSFSKLTATVNTLKKEKDNLETDLHELNAYNRRCNIEIRNIPENISDEKLESYCIDVLSKINLYVAERSIVGAHRLGKKVNGRIRSVIIRFVNRKDAYYALDNQHRLKFTPFKRLFITENLCPTYKQIFNILYKAKKNRIIADVWSYNGIVHPKMTENGDRFRMKTLEMTELFLATAQSAQSVRNDENNEGNNNVNGRSEVEDLDETIGNLVVNVAEETEEIKENREEANENTNVDGSVNAVKEAELLLNVLQHVVVRSTTAGESVPDIANVHKINNILGNSTV